MWLSLAKQFLFLFEFCFHLLGSASLTMSPATTDSSPVYGNFEWFLSFILIVKKKIKNSPFLWQGFLKVFSSEYRIPINCISVALATAVYNSYYIGLCNTEQFVYSSSEFSVKLPITPRTLSFYRP